MVKYKQLASLLREKLKHFSQGCKLPTERELSLSYQVSRQTVRHALDLLAEEGLIRRRQGSGSFVANPIPDSTSHQIAVITSFLDDHTFPSILQDIQGVFARYGYSTLVYATENQLHIERDILWHLLEQPTGGALIEGSKTALPNPNSNLYQRLRGAGTPLVFLNGSYPGLSEMPCISDDNYGGGYQLVNYLIQRGHRRIAGIFQSDDVQGLQRYHGCISALCDANLPVLDRFFCWYAEEDQRERINRRDFSWLRQLLLTRLREASAIICYDGEIAFLLIRELLALGKRVPEDVAVVSFDDSCYNLMSSISITALRRKSNRMGAVAAEHLLQILHGGKEESRILPLELVERKSS